jgi:hypothetical protein
MQASLDQEKKADAGKLRWSLLTVQFNTALRCIARVLCKGATKYPDPPRHQSWRTVEDAVRRYKDAFDRHADPFHEDIAHFLEYKKLNDFHILELSVSHDFKELHIDHMIVNLLFLRDLIYGQNRDITITRPRARKKPTNVVA